MISPTHLTRQSVRYSSGITETRSSEIAVEFEVALSVNSAAWLSFRCSPENLEAMAAGYLYNESFIESAEEIAAIDICEQRDHVDVWLNHDVTKPDTWSRTTGCQGGVTRSGAWPVSPIKDLTVFPVSEVLLQVDKFLTEINKPGFPQHGVHTTMLLDNHEIVSLCNDIGRHNTLDKIAGECLLKQINLREPVLITTGRISSEMVYKAARMQVPLAISLHSVSQVAIQAAESLGMTLVGHARRSQIDIYSHPERIIIPTSSN